MGKQIFIFILALLVAGAFYIVVERPDLLPRAIRDKVEEVTSLGQAPSKVTLPVLKELPANTIAVFGVIPQNAKALVEYFAGLYLRMYESKLARKARDNGQDTDPLGTFRTTLSEPDQKVFDETIKNIKFFWDNVDNVVIAITEDLFQVESVELPRFLLNVSFSTSLGTPYIKRLIDEDLLGGQPSITTSDTVLLRDANSPNKYRFIIDVSGAKQQIAALTLGERNARLVIGGEPESSFKAEGSADALPQAPHWKKISGYIDGSSFLFGGLYSPSVVNFVDQKVLPKVPDQDRDKAKEFFKAYFSIIADSDGIMFGVKHKDGLVGENCIIPRSGTKLASLYTSIFEDRANRPPKDTFERLLSPRTVLALRFGIAGFEQVLGQYRATFLGLGSLGTSPQEAEEARLFFQEADNFVSKFGFQDIGIFLNAPAGIPMPDGGLFFGGSKLKGDLLMEEAAKYANDLARRASGDQSVSVFTIETSNGQKRLKLMIPDQQIYIAGYPVGDNGILFSTNPTLANLSTESPTEIKKRNKKGLDLVNRLDESDTYLYVNSEPALNFGKPFLPMVLAQQPEGPVKIEYSEVEEILDLFNGAAIQVTTSKQDSASVVCAEQIITGLN